MESGAEVSVETIEREDSESSPSDMLMESSIEKSSSTRRSSDGGPPPFQRNRSFKTKQLVRSQAIRESQSPPRVPSPRAAAAAGDLRDHFCKIKSASFDMDDRPPPLDASKLIICDTPSISTKSIANNSSIDEKSSFKTTTTNLASSNNNNNNDKNVLVNDKKTLGANNNINENKVSLECKVTQKNDADDDDVCEEENIEKSHPEENFSKVTTNSRDLDGCNSLPLSSDPSNDESRKCLTDNKKSIQNPPNRKYPENESEARDKNRTAGKNDVNQIEIQVTSGDIEISNASHHSCKRSESHSKSVGFHSYTNKFLCNKDCDCGIGPSLELDEDDECVEEESKYYSTNNNNNTGRRAMCASKQDSGVCCWESCNCCGDISPEIILSDAEDENRFRCQRSLCEQEHLSGCEFSRSSEYRNEKWTKRNGSTLSVQRSNSGGNPRLLRKQSSGGGSMDSGQHSIASPFLSRDSSTEVNAMCWDGDVSKFIKETLNKSLKDRQTLLKVEEELISFIKDSSQKEIKFPATSSYGRLLVHRCADLFSLRHMLDPVSRSMVLVSKLPLVGLSYKVPSICPFKQWCTSKFPSSPTNIVDMTPPAKSILKRDKESFDEEPSSNASGPPKLLQTPKSKSFEQREEEYVKARRRIFNSGQFQSMENTPVTPNVRGVVLKAHSFGGYGGRPGVQRGDSVTSSTSAPPHRILSRQGELASNCWRLSPCSSGYKTFSGRSDSITPSPTSTPHAGSDGNSASKNADGEPQNSKMGSQKVPGVLWAISDMSTVPSGAVIIHPQTGEALTNSDGTLYHYDPSKPLHSALLPSSQQLIPDNVKVLSNPERRRSRLEKQRATLSPGIELDSISLESKKSSISPNELFVEGFNPDDYEEINCIERHETSSRNSVLSPKLHENLNTVAEVQEQSFDSLKSEPESVLPNPSPPEYDSRIENQSIENENSSSKEIENNKTSYSGSPNSQSPSSKEYYEKDEQKSINYDANDSEVSQYQDLGSTTYYNIPAHATPSQYFQPGPMYQENNPEVYAGHHHHHQLNYVPRPSETVLPSTTMPSQMTHSHIVYAQPSEPVGMAPANEICYPTVQAPLLIQPPQYRYNEQDPQPSYHLVPTLEHQQPIIFALPSKITEQDVSGQQLPGYPMASFHPQIERSPIIGPPPLLGMAPPPNQAGYQLQNAPAWGCWPQMTIYATQPPPAPITEESKYPQNIGYLPQPPPPETLGAMNVSPLPQTFYSSLIQPGQFYSPFTQSSPLVQAQIPLYQQYSQDRSSVLSNEGSTTPNFHNYDNTYKAADSSVQEDHYKGRSNAKSPKSANSRGPSLSGSSRTTPLTNTGNVNIPEGNVDPSFCANYHFVHPPLNYIPYPYPYNVNVAGLDCVSVNFENPHLASQTKLYGNDGFGKVNKQFHNKDQGRSAPVNSFPNGILQTTDNVPTNAKMQSEFNAQLNKINSTISVNSDSKAFIKPRDKRKYNKSLSLTEQDDEKSSENNNNIIAKGVVHPVRDHQIRQSYSNESTYNRSGPPNRDTRPTRRDIKDLSNQFASSNLSNDAKTFVPKMQLNNADSSNVQVWENRNVNSDQSIKLAKQVGNVSDQQQEDSKANWRRFQNQKESVFHNFPKNLSKLNQRQSTIATDKYANRSQFKEKTFTPNTFQPKQRVQSKYDNVQSTTPSRLSTPPVAWNRHSPSTPNNPSLPNDMPGLFPTPNIHQPPPLQVNLHQSNRLSKSTGEGSGSRANWNRVNSLDAAQHRLMEAGLVGLQNASFYPRGAQNALQNVGGNNGGLGMLPTPPLHQGQQTFLIRQVPNWIRRPGPGLFGPSPSVPGHIRPRAQRHHQSRF